MNLVHLLCTASASKHVLKLPLWKYLRQLYPSRKSL
jgi:hypothetical protein